jgi:hypothetical protein
MKAIAWRKQMPYLTVKLLKELIAEMPDDAVAVSLDHPSGKWNVLYDGDVYEHNSPIHPEDLEWSCDREQFPMGIEKSVRLG